MMCHHLLMTLDDWKDLWIQSKVNQKIRKKKQTLPGKVSMNQAKMVTDTLFLLGNIMQWIL
jgi:prophage antirepressor-like protein